MEVQWALVAHGLVTTMVVVSFLCGHLSIFQGTFVERIHYFITVGAYDYFLRFVAVTCGSRGRDAVLKVEYYCCDRPNPILQVLYLAIIGVTYFFTAKSSFVYIPGVYLHEMHKYIGTFAVGVGVLLFVLTSFSDPGTVKPENVSRYLSAYPYDNVIYNEKECSTCKIPKLVITLLAIMILFGFHFVLFIHVGVAFQCRPARSKHCSVCGRCVARFDHHCGWMNNCIGEKNTRYFLAFLVWHFFLCLYGTILLGLVLAGELQERKIIYILTVYYGIEKSFSSLFPHVVQWLVASFNTQILLTVFLLIVSLLLGGFFGFHAHLCITNTTTNETFKWQEYFSWKRKLNEAKASAAALKASLHAMNGERSDVKESKWRSFFRRSPLQNGEVVVKNNVYDKGFVYNVLEVAFPLSDRHSFYHQKSP